MRAALLLLIAPACIFSSGGMADDVCPLAEDIATAPLRDPSTGTCESFGGGCRGIPYPDWAVCGGSCDALGEADCKDTPACRAIYTGTIGGPLTYLGCWGTAPNSTLAGVDCTKLDPFQCSQDQDCSAVFAQPTAPPMTWAGCIAERRPLDPGTCSGALCNIAPPACPTGTVAGVKNGCWSGYCIPKTDCAAPGDPGTCDGALCAIASPACPAGTTPGVVGACYSGYCIPDSACASMR